MNFSHLNTHFVPKKIKKFQIENVKLALFIQQCAMNNHILPNQKYVVMLVKLEFGGV